MGLLSKIFNQKSKVEISTKMIKDKAEIPPYQGDYAKTVFLYTYSKSKPIKKKNEYQKYFLYDLGIKDAQSFHKKMISEGLLVKDSADKSLSILKVDELKNILSELNQKTIGKKEELIDRIISTTGYEKYLSSLPETYSISEEGQRFLDDHTDYIKLHQHPGYSITWQEYDKMHRGKASFNDTVWGILNNRIANPKDGISNMYSADASTYYSMYYLLMEEGKRDYALERLLNILYIETSGITCYDATMSEISLLKSKIYKLDDIYSHAKNRIYIPSGLVDDLAKFTDIYNDKYIEPLYKTKDKFPIKLCDEKWFTSLVHSIMNGTYDEKKATDYLMENYKKAVKKLAK